MEVSEPTVWLRIIHSVLMVTAAIGIIYVVRKSLHSRSIFYRVGMMAIAAGAFVSPFQVIGVLPVGGSEWWMIKDLGIVIVVAMMVRDYGTGRIQSA